MKKIIFLLFLGSMKSLDSMSQIRYDKAYGVNIYAWPELYTEFDVSKHIANIKHPDSKILMPEGKNSFNAGWDPGVGIFYQFSDYLPALRFENLYRLRSFEAGLIVNQYSTEQFYYRREVLDTSFIRNKFFTEERHELSFSYIQEIHNKGKKHSGVFIGLGFAINQGLYRTGHYLEENYYYYDDNSLPGFHERKKAYLPWYEADYHMRPYTTAKLFVPVGIEFFGLKQSKFRVEIRPGFGYEYGWGGTFSERIQLPVGFGFYYVSGLKRGKVI